MKKAVVMIGGLQYIVAEGDEITVNFVGSTEKKIEVNPLMIIDGDKSELDAKKLEAIKVTCDVVGDLKGEKVIALRYKAKKRVQTRRGHRQMLTKLKVASIK